MADGSLLFNTKLDASGFQKGLGKLSTLAKTGMGGVGNAAKSAMGIANKALMAGSAAVAGLGAYAIKAGSDFSAGMSEVQAISGATGDDLEALKAKAKEMGSTTKFSATESAEALKYMSMAGWDTQKMLDGLPGVMNLAAASGENLGLVSDIVTDSMTAFGIEASKAGEFADVLAMTSSKSNTNVALLGESFKYVAPLAGALGYSSEDTAVALGLMANAGIKGSQAGTTLKTSLANLAKPSKQMATYMDKLGISMTDSAGEVKPLDQLLREMRGSFADLSEAEQAQAASAIFGKESMAGMLAILNTSEADFDSLTKSINNSTGAAEDMAKVMNDNLRGDVTLLQSALEGLGISLYEGMDNPAREVVKAFTGYMGQLQSAIDGPDQKLNDFLAKTGMTAEEAGVVIAENQTMIERVAGAFGDILGDMAAQIADQAPKIVDAAKTLIESFFEGISENREAIGQAAVEVITGLIETLISFHSQFFGVGLTLIQKIATGFAENAPELVGTLVAAVKSLVESLETTLPSLLEAGGKILLALIQGVAEVLPDLAVAAVNIVTTLLTSIYEFLPSLIESGIGLIMSLVDGIVQALPMLIEALPQVINTFLEYIGEAIPMILEGGMNILMALIEGIVQNLPILTEAVVGIIESIAQFFTENLPMLIDTAITILNTLIAGIMDNLPMFIEAVIELVNSIVSTISENLPLLIEAAIEMIMALANGIIENLDDIIRAAVEITDALIIAIVDNLPALIEAAIQIVIAVAEGIIDNLDTLIPAIVDLINVIVGAMIDRLDLLINAAFRIIQAVTDGLLDNLDMIIEATIKLIAAITTEIVDRLPELVAMGLRIVTELIGGIIGAIPDLIAAAFELIFGFLGEITKNLPDILAAGAGLVGSLTSGILGAIGSIVGAAGDIAGAALGAVKEGFSGAMDIGKDLVSGLWNGINDKKDWVVDKVKGIGGSIMSGLKGFFGIKSPSRLMRDEIGKMIPPGIGVGIEAAAPAMLRTADAEMDKLHDKLTAGITLDSTIQAKSPIKERTVWPVDTIKADDGSRMLMSGDLHSTIQIDGRPVAKAITPYVSEEQSLNKKRRA